MIIKAKGSILSNIFFGDHFLDLLVPYRVNIDTSTKILTISKRNYYFIGIDKTTIPISNVRRVNINRHLFGADLSIKIYGSGDVHAKCLSKRDAINLYNYLTSIILK
jgi:hypothetical protein